MAMEPVLTETHGRVLVITLNRPDVRNAIDSAVVQGLLDAFARLDDDTALHVGVLAGAGRDFCAGMDLKAFADSGTPQGLQRVLRYGAAKPLIAAIEGVAVAGGLELALTCDLVVAGKGARLGLPEVGVGLFAAGGALIRLPGRVPFGTAMELALTGDSISAEAAHAHGLVDRLSEPGRAVAVALELAERIARNAPLSVLHTKAVLRDSWGRPEDEGWERQKPAAKLVFTSDDSQEGARAFLEKREPRWTGR
jgi:enoyl-CoA hydratase